jgi:uncharacterized protein
MELFVIPIEGQYLIYRPLRQTAFVGNRAMAEITRQLAAQTPAQEPAVCGPDLPPDVAKFLSAVGFLEADPPPPPEPTPDFCPTTAVLLLTNRCHLCCVYCYANAGVRPASDLRWELAQSVIDNACANAQRIGQTQFALSLHGGGEPVMAWSLIKQAVAYARSKPLACTVSLTSNGLWSSQQTRWILEHVDNVSLSVDGGPATQDRQRPLAKGGGSWTSVQRTIMAMDAAAYPYSIRMTALPPWRESLPLDVEYLCRTTRCATMQVEPAFNTVRGEHSAPTEKDADAFVAGFMAAFDVAETYGRKLVYSAARPWQLTQKFCGAPYGALIVTPSGRLVSCYEVTADDHPLAALSHVGDVVGGALTVNEAQRQKLLAQIDSRRAGCHDCFCRWHCAGDCYVRTYDGANDYMAYGARCQINRSLTAQLLIWLVMRSGGVWRGPSIPAAGAIANDTEAAAV